MGQKYNPSLPINGLKFLYDFGNPRSYPGSGTSLFNLIGPDHLTIDGGPGWASVGHSSYVYCDGSQILYNDNLSQTLPVQGPLTISLVYNPITVAGTKNNYFSLGNSAGTSQLQYGIPNTNSPIPSIFKGGGTAVTIATHGFAGLGTVIHVTYTVDGSNNSKIYVNGVLTSTSTTALATGVGSKLKLNANSNNSDAGDAAYYWFGIWDRVLSDKEVGEVWQSFKRRWGFDAGTSGTTAGTPSPLALGTQTANTVFAASKQSFTNEIPTKIYYSSREVEIESQNTYSFSWLQRFGGSGTANTICIPIIVRDSFVASYINWYHYFTAVGVSETYKIGIYDDNGYNSPDLSVLRGETSVLLTGTANTVYNNSVAISGVALTANKRYWAGFTFGATASTSATLCYMWGPPYGPANNTLNIRTFSGAGVASTYFYGVPLYVSFSDSQGKVYSTFGGTPPAVNDPTYYVPSDNEVGIYLYIPKNHPSLRLSAVSFTVNSGSGTTYYIKIRDSLGNLLSNNAYDTRQFLGSQSLAYPTMITLDNPYYLHNDNFYAIMIGAGTTFPGMSFGKSGYGITSVYTFGGNGMSFVPIQYDTTQYIRKSDRNMQVSLQFDRLGFESSSGLSVIS